MASAMSQAARGSELLSARQIAELGRKQESAKLYSNLLGQACFALDCPAAEAQLAALRAAGLLDVGVAFVSEVRPAAGEARGLRAREVRQFQTEMGCPPLVLACLGCARRLEELRGEAGIRADASRSAPEKEVEAAAGAVVELLLQHGASVHAADVGPLANSALHTAARAGAPHLLSALLRAGADCTLRNSEGNSAEILASRAGHATCEQILQVVAGALLAEAEALVEDIEGGGSAKEEEQSNPRQRQPTGLNGNLPREPAYQADHDGEQDSGGAEEDAEYAPYSKQGGYWSVLDEENQGGSDLDADLDSEWDSPAVRRGRVDLDDEDDAQPSASSSSRPMDDAGEDIEELRLEVMSLRSANSAYQKDLDQLVAECEAALRAAEAEERDAARLDNRAARLLGTAAEIGAEAAPSQPQVQAAADGRGPGAGAEGEAEAKAAALSASRKAQEVCRQWKDRTTVHKGRAAELGQALGAQQREHTEAAEVLAREIREGRARTKGLEDYVRTLDKARLENEQLQCHASEQHAAVLVNQIQELISGLKISEDLKAQLPPLFVEDVAEDDESCGISLVPLPELTPSLGVYRRLLGAQCQHESRYTELLDYCNKHIEGKDKEIYTSVEEALLQAVLPDLAGEDSAALWAGLSRSAGEALRKLRAAARTPARVE